MKMLLEKTEFIKASEVKIPDTYYNRIKTGIKSIDDFLGGSEEITGGLLKGGVYMLAAGAGLGKSTFCLQVSETLLKSGKKIAYATGEESLEQLAFTCKRLNVNEVPIAVKTDIDDICSAMANLDVIIVDSFQSLTVKKNMTNRKKENYCISRLCYAAKQNSCCVIALCHLTKAGIYKGSTTLLHSADACFYLEADEEEPTIRNFYWTKNRFGPASTTMQAIIDRTGYIFE
jgi:DNA repair protein RadA/Sms